MHTTCFSWHLVTFRRNLCLSVTATIPSHKEGLKVVIKVRYLLLKVLSLVITLCDSLDILDDDDPKVFIEKVALLVPDQVYILFGPYYPLVVFFFPPLIKVEDQLSRKVNWIIELSPEVDPIAATVQDKPVSYPHTVN